MVEVTSHTGVKPPKEVSLKSGSSVYFRMGECVLSCILGT